MQAESGKELKRFKEGILKAKGYFDGNLRKEVRE